VSTNTPPINEAVALLERFAPEVLTELRITFPQLGSELSPGQVLGPAEDGVSKHSDETINVMSARARVVRAALDAAIAYVTIFVERLEKRIRTARRIRLTSQVCAAVGTSSVLAGIKVGVSEITFGSACFALASSIGALLSEAIDGGEKNRHAIGVTYVKVCELRARAGQLNLELSLFPERMSPSEEKEIAKLIRLAQDLLFSVNTEIAKAKPALGFSV
jgi:hypothetical protein